MSYREALLKTIGEWNRSPILDEWVFEKFRDAFVSVMTTEEAFNSIGGTIDVLLAQSDESTSIEVLQTVIALAAQSETTEVPQALLSTRHALEKHFESFGAYAKAKMNELFRYYRLAS